MSEIKEYIGCKSIQGNNLYNMWLTDTEIIRCKDCKNSIFGGERCRLWSYDGDKAWVDPNGFCFFAERREA